MRRRLKLVIVFKNWILFIVKILAFVPQNFNSTDIYLFVFVYSADPYFWWTICAYLVLICDEKSNKKYLLSLVKMNKKRKRVEKKGCFERAIYAIKDEFVVEKRTFTQMNLNFRWVICKQFVLKKHFRAEKNTFCNCSNIQNNKFICNLFCSAPLSVLWLKIRSPKCWSMW